MGTSEEQKSPLPGYNKAGKIKETSPDRASDGDRLSLFQQNEGENPFSHDQMENNPFNTEDEERKPAMENYNPFNTDDDDKEPDPLAAEMVKFAKFVEIKEKVFEKDGFGTPSTKEKRPPKHLVESMVVASTEPKEKKLENNEPERAASLGASKERME